MEHNHQPVIQFFSDGVKRRMGKGYYIPENEWNPTGEIELVTLSDIPALKEDGLIFTQTPDLNGVSTFIQSPLNANEYIPMDKYTEKIVLKREEAVENILVKLGVKEYFVQTSKKLRADFGKENEGGGEGEAGYLGSKVQASANGKSAFNAHAHVGSFQHKHHIYATFTPSVQQWEEARRKAVEFGIYEGEIYNILEARKPGDNPKLLYSKTVIRMDAGISINLDIASKLAALVNIRGIANASGSFFSELQFNASAQYEYETEIIYNFAPDKDYEEIQRALDRVSKKVGQ